MADSDEEKSVTDQKEISDSISDTDASSSNVIIIDNGSGYMKAGLNTDSAPTVVFPTIAGRPRKRFVDLYDDISYIGHEAWSLRHHFSFTKPIDHGHIDDWIEMEEVWNHVFQKLSVKPSNHPVLLTEPPLCSQVHREKMAEVMLETFQSPEINISCQGLMGIYATGRTSGFIVDIGEGVTQCVPVFDGYTDVASIKRSDFGGLELSMYLQKILCDMGYPMTSRDDQEHIRKVKETICFCSMSPAEDQEREDLAKSYVLPEGMTLRDGVTNEIVLGPERFYPPEALFNPQLCGRDSPPLTDLIWQSILACPIETRKPLMGSIILAGGCSQFPGFDARLQLELQNTAPPKARNSVKVSCVEESPYLAWHGCKTFAAPALRPLQNHCWVTREEWDEFGKNIIHKKAVLKIM